MNRRSFIGSFFAAFATATLRHRYSSDVYAIDFAIEENIGYGIINPAAMADAYAAIFAHDMTPDYMFMHPSRGKQRWPMPQQFYELKKVFNPVIAKKALMEAYPGCEFTCGDRDSHVVWTKRGRVLGTGWTAEEAIEAAIHTMRMEGKG